ncbi:LPXTG cell wall anchor domain-containing protein [Clostridium sp. OS1-26]|uniref:LPXTG cell wall anchor domain-containing protein n=1 Tax=Clostridium sp. OS1-26 TaxID=3070681 RepID=UPI0027E111D9|nr:LPXTG cell wall anchor domain-containing protein [Clostridium sp. OS1-26]WML35996.1 LPXTG cell wall anchor domain-containing protein [Clostridium sp. OS1-26]
MSRHHHCRDNNNFFPIAALAALIAFFLLIFGRRRGTRFAVLITLAIIIVCGCSGFNRDRDRC